MGAAHRLDDQQNRFMGRPDLRNSVSGGCDKGLLWRYRALKGMLQALPTLGIVGFVQA
jgi:hypothetical protein